MTSSNILIGRSSSHFTRVARIFAAELDVSYSLLPLRDLSSPHVAHYGGNPALKIPVLKTESGVWFGSLPVCQEFHRRSSRSLRVIWPHELTTSETSNAQELVLHAMATEVNLLLSRLPGATPQLPQLEKMQASLAGTLAWLETHVDSVLAGLPPRDLSFLEVTLYCLLAHLPFREVMDVSQHERLSHFAAHYAERESVKLTPFFFDQ